MAAIFRTRTRDDWCARLEGTDVCFAPVLSMDEAADHPHNRARDAFIDVAGVRQPAPAPRFGTTVPDPPRAPGSVDAKTVLADWGLDSADIDRLMS
jgi:alpha-methylacyl-CoA racemase